MWHVARSKDVRQRIIDLALLTRPENVAIFVHGIILLWTFGWGDTNPDTPLNNQQLSSTALMTPEAGKRLSPQPRGGFGDAQKNN